MNRAILMAEHRAAFRDNSMRSVDGRYYNWKVYENPATEGFIYLEERGGFVVGSSSVMPRKVVVGDREVLGAELGDSFTRPEYRRQGINSKALNECIKYALSKGMNLVYGPPNRANYGLHIKLGFLQCSYIKVAFMTKSLNPMRFGVKLMAKMILGRDLRKSYLQFGNLVRTAMKKRHDVSDERDEVRNAFQILEIDKFRDEVDPLWGNPRYSFFIFRDSRYLNWRYFENPDRFRVLAAVEGGEYLGYIVLKMAKDKRTAILCDFVTIDDRADVFLELVKRGEETQRQSGARVVNLMCIVDSPYYRELTKLGYYDLGPEEYQPVVVYGGTTLGRRILEMPGKWHFTYGDTDEV